ncbi:MAG: hypothetical protein GY774_35530 [Planctomycetes bacterium]|nr:hypothetical protein [Planctomycetota bacterium]
MINGYTPDFLDWYDANTQYPGYPVKKGKQDAQKAWTQLKRQKILPEGSVLKNAVLNQIKEHKYKEGRNEWCADFCWPATWLRGWRWEDECELPEFKKVLSAEEKWLQRISR